MSPEGKAWQVRLALTKKSRERHLEVTPDELRALPLEAFWIAAQRRNAGRSFYTQVGRYRIQIHDSSYYSGFSVNFGQASPSGQDVRTVSGRRTLSQARAMAAHLIEVARLDVER